MIAKSDVREIWEKHGLISPRRGSRGKLPAVSGITRASALAAALSELGGYYQAFGVFLAGRLDLLPAYYVDPLASIQVPFLGDTAREADLSSAGIVRKEVIGQPLFCRVWSADLNGKAVIVEELALSATQHEALWRAFESGITFLADSFEGTLLAPAVLEEYREWLEIHLDLGRKARMMANLQSAPSGCLLQVPLPVESLSTPTVLVYEQLRNAEAIDDSGRRTEIVVESILEQFIVLSFISACPRAAELRLVDGKRMTFRVWPFLLPIPVQHYYPLLQYLASSVADDSARAVRMLVKLVRAEGGQTTEGDVWKKISGLKFEMGLDEMLPGSILRITETWRALAGTGARLPLHLNLVHRQLVLSGRSWVSSGVDWLPVATATVLTRLVQFRTAGVLGLEGGREWGMGGGLMLLGAFRQVGTLLEQLRENDLSITVTTSTGADRTSGNGSSWLRAVIPGLLFATSIQLALVWSGSHAGLWLAALATLSGVAFLWTTIRGTVG